MFLYSFIMACLPKEPSFLAVKIGTFVAATGAFIDLTSNFSTYLDIFEAHNLLHNILFVIGGIFLIAGFIFSLFNSYKQKLSLKAFISSYKGINLNTTFEAFLEKLLESLISSIPSAKKGSVIVREEDHYSFKAAKGYDIEKLKSIRIGLDEFPDLHLKEVALIKKIQKRFDRFPNEIFQKLLEVQDVNIKSTIVIPAKESEVVFYIDFEQSIPEVRGIYGDLLESMRIFISSLIEKYGMYQQLRNIYDKDPLTQTYSRAGIETILKNIERNPKGNSLVIIDIDEFKKVNDLYGHQVGDEFLRFFVEELRKRLRSSDKIIRFGGDEFLILMENCDLSDAVKKMEFASEDIKKTKFFVRESNVLLPVSFSYGISYIQSKDQFDKAVSKADKKLYEMKIYKKHLMNREQSDEV